MQFPTPLVPARLIRRYKRFLSDVRLEDGEEVVAHCPNPGSMMGLNAPGMKVWLEPNDDPRKKLKYGWRLVEPGDATLVCIDTGWANKVVGEALRAGRVPGFESFGSVRAEVPYGSGSRVDFLLRGEGHQDLYLEVKSVTLSRAPGVAEFPDSVTARGAKHLAELAEVAGIGQRAVMLYLVQRTDCSEIRLAGDIDPSYARAAADARSAGVEMLGFAADITPEGITLGRPVPVLA